MYMGQQNYWKNVSAITSSLQIQYRTYQNSNDILHRNKTDNPEIYMEAKASKIVSNDIGITVCDLKLYYRAILNKTATKAQTQTNGTEAPEISLQTDSLLYFKKYIKSIYWKNNSLISHWSQEIHLYKNMTRSISLTHDQSS